MSEKKTILIIEDDPDVRLGCSVYLGRTFDVTTAEDSISGLMLARRLRPDAIVLDLGLPGGDGLQLLDRMQQIPEISNTPVVVCSGRDSATMVAEAEAAGAARAFQKPVVLDELESALLEQVARPTAAPRHALVVDDDADTREGLATQLRSLDFAVTECEDGASAVMQARRTTPDVVLLDLGLPCGDGFAVLRRMRDIPSLQDVPIIVVSGRERADVERGALRCGADAYVQKPACADLLNETLMGVL